MKRLAVLTGALTAGALCLGSVAWATTRDDTVPAPAAAPTGTVAPAGDGTGMDHRHASMDDGSMSDGSMSDGSMSDGSMSDGSMSDGSMSDGSTTDHRHMDMSLPPLAERRAQASPDQRAAADKLWADTKAAVAPYENIDNALAAGFRPNPTQTGNTTIHYPNNANRRDDRQLDPSHPEGLVYHHNPDGTYTLLGAVYTAAAGEPAPTPGGPIFSWHTHQPSCGTFFVPAGQCTDTFRMLHVWVAPGVVDPFTQPFAKATQG